MAMNIKSGDSDEMSPVAEINVTPMVDVMLVLLIIFMVTAPLMMSQLPLKPPKDKLQDMGKPRDPLIVSLDENSVYHIDTGSHSEEVPLADLEGRLAQIAKTEPDNIVFIRADKTLDYGKVVGIMKIVADSGFYKVSLMSEAPQ
jgi:biopolymer transport protein ExbD